MRERKSVLSVALDGGDERASATPEEGVMVIKIEHPMSDAMKRRNGIPPQNNDRGSNAYTASRTLASPGIFVEKMRVFCGNFCGVSLTMIMNLKNA